MTEETQIVERTPLDTKIAKESYLLNMSVRSILTLLVVSTVCLMSLRMIKIEEPLYTLVGMVVGYYFGQGTKPKNQQ